MKSVILSIRPKRCELIANGEKTIEVRKTRPKLDTPFKCYIYCTISGTNSKERDHNVFTDFSGKVIGEFTCDRISTYAYSPDCTEWSDPRTLMYYITTEEGEATGLSYDEFCEYGGGKDLYGWNISNLKIYDTPKALSEFTGRRQTRFGIEPYRMKRPPQSWCYVEECKT
jgi:predicted transcriptional regulator